MNLHKYVEVAKIEVSERFSHFWNQFSWSIFICVIIIVYLNLWTAIFAEGSTILGYTMQQMIWYVAIAEVIVMGLYSVRIEQLGEIVRSGDLAMQLNKPISFLGREFALGLGVYIQKILVTGVIVCGFTYALVGPIAMNWTTLPVVVLLLLGAYIVQFGFTRSLGLLAFWFEDVKGFYFIYTKMVFIFGGMLVPIDVYPEWTHAIIHSLPFSYMVYFPARLLVEFSWDNVVNAIAGQLIWGTVLALLCVQIFRKGVRKVNMHGG